VGLDDEIVISISDISYTFFCSVLTTNSRQACSAAVQKLISE